MNRKFLCSMLLSALSVAGCTRQTQTAQPAAPANVQATNAQATNASPPAAPTTHLKVGDPAPAFTLTDTKGEKVSLSDFHGKKNVVLAFYVLAFTGG